MPQGIGVTGRFARIRALDPAEGLRMIPRFEAIPRFLLALLLSAMPACKGSVRPMHTRASDLGFAAARRLGRITQNVFQLGPEARPCLVPYPRPKVWPPIHDFRSDAIDLDAGATLTTAIGMKTFGYAPQEADRPRFTLTVEGSEGQANLLDEQGRTDFEPDRWVPVRARIPAGLGSPLTFHFSVTYPSGLKETRRSTAVWAVPRINREVWDERPNVLLVVFDTLRADHTQIYGYPRATTPFLSKLAAQGAVLETLIAPYPSTLTSHWSMFTGLDPPHHGGYPGSKKHPSDTTLAELLHRAGYRTAAFTEGGYVHSFFGFSRGFDSYHNGPDQGTDEFNGSAPETFARALEWIRHDADSRFFMFLQTYQVHAPYTPPPEYLAMFEKGYSGPWAQAFPVQASFSVNNEEVSLSAAQIRHIGALYDAEIRYLDDSFARFWTQLETLGIPEDTLVVILSDHGEDLMEHGWLHHGTTVYDPALRVPFVVRWPGHVPAGARLDCQRPMVDVMPTLLDLIDLEVPKALDGQSFAEDLGQGRCRKSRPAFTELLSSPYEREGKLPITSLRQGGWKLIRPRSGRAQELYDLSLDAEEKENQVDRKPKLAARMARAIDAYLSRARKDREDSAAPDLTPAVRERLRGLGYVE